MASISNQAQVSFSYEGSTGTRSNNSNVVNATLLDEYSLTVEKTTSRECYRPGDTLTYFIQVINSGCGCLKNFHITDNLGDEGYLTYVEGSARLIVGGILEEITPTSVSPLEFDVSDRIERGEGFVILYNTEVREDLSEEVNEITNTVEVTGYPCGCDCNNNNNSVTETSTATVTKCEFAEVLITKQASRDTYCCDEEIDFVITLTNTGTVDATDVVVTDSLPENFTLTNVSMENNGEVYEFGPTEYTLDNTNLLTLPNAAGRAILVPSIAPGVDNTTRIRIHGHM